MPSLAARHTEGLCQREGRIVVVRERTLLASRVGSSATSCAAAIFENQEQEKRLTKDVERDTIMQLCCGT